jgi:hypothetical protein
MLVDITKKRPCLLHGSTDILKKFKNLSSLLGIKGEEF